jgi:hypothetical protein
LYADILEYDKIKLTQQNINKVLESISSDNTELINHVREYMTTHFMKQDFSTYMILAAHNSENPSELNAYLNKADDYANSTGDCKLIRSELVQQELVLKHKDHNSVLQKIMKTYSAERVHPENPEFYDWKYEKPQPVPETQPETNAEEKPEEAQEESQEKEAEK